ncbi:magnesium transporter CorA family protein [Azospirillum rugosum]|uniref:Magnesium transporter n=1 Tax=Azospirillum rugosum TaxID=416170 RepID=A0ABS4SI81_9PROT|nr:magnesium transporter CorA family protein [Azospirillum rugosum]MBP2292274.1 magnesium transporter [Azospirillum rugosum]MDQ0526033.1 magnesium transporter [Azospirillum rugosum]
MLHAFVKDGGTLRWSKEAEQDAEQNGGPLPAATTWIDLLNPTPEELARAEALMGVALPTREQMAEIEESSRLRITPGAVHMTVMALLWADTDRPSIVPVSFVLAGGRLATIHPVDPQPFLAFRRRVTRSGCPVAKGAATGGEAVLAALVEAMVERTAGVLRRVGLELDTMSSRAFRGRALPSRTEKSDDTRTLKRIGHTGHLVGKAHVSLASLHRMLTFLARGEGWTAAKPTRRWARATLQDVVGLSEYARFLAGKVGLLLDTTLGQINVEQNEIVKIVSILTVGLFPPTLVATVYGMNFAGMPEKSWEWGYPLAILLMVLSALLPMLYFRSRRWL